MRSSQFLHQSPPPLVGLPTGIYFSLPSEAPAPAHLPQLGHRLGVVVVVLKRLPHLREPAPQAVLQLLALTEAVAHLDRARRVLDADHALVVGLGWRHGE
eukprot:scaffold57350_cov69-Phaeocystis_antarctica.AAC.4